MKHSGELILYKNFENGELFIILHGFWKTMIVNFTIGLI